MVSENRVFFSVVIPLYNKEKHVKETIETVLNQTFQNFEIVVVNDGSTDGSAKIVETMNDSRIRLIHQENTGVSVARNRGIQETKADYIAFLDADDIWLPEFLQTIYELIQNFPEAGLYATAYKKRKANGEEIDINIQGLPSKDYVGLIPNYFKSIVLGENLVWTSAVCIPKEVFIKNDIWFPVGEKFGEDQYVWARVAMISDIAYCTKACAVYCIETDNNTIDAIMKEKEPHKSILMLKYFRDTIQNEEKLKYFDKYIQRHIAMFIWLNMQKGKKYYALNQIFKYRLSFRYFSILIIRSFIPLFCYSQLKNLKKWLKI